MIIKYDNKAIKYTNKWISVDSEPTPPPIYYIYAYGINGSIGAVPPYGISGTEVTLSNTPDTGYNFDKYTLISGTGASISDNILTIGTSNVTVRGDFTEAPVEYVQIGNLLWQTANVNIDSLYGMVVRSNIHYYNSTGVAYLTTQLSDGWRVPTYDDFVSLANAVNYYPSQLCATSPYWTGTNTTGFNAMPRGFYYTETSSVEGFGTAAYFYGTQSRVLNFNTDTLRIDNFSDISSEMYCTVRLCKDAT